MTLEKTLLKLFAKFRTLIIYGTIGLLAAGLDFLIYFILTQSFNSNYLIANMISVHCGIITSFILNRQFNFKVKNKTIIRFFTFYGIGLLGLLISFCLLYLFIDIYSINILLSKLITILIVALVQFILNKTITFNTNKI